ncbi:MAG: hypothetical protein RR233_06315 [Clostridiales bacterium]
MRIVGVAFAKGEYEGRPYHKVRFHCVGEFDKEDNTAGQSVEMYSLNYDDCGNIFEYVGGNIDSLIGLNIEPMYNKYGKVSKVLVQE